MSFSHRKVRPYISEAKGYLCLQLLRDGQLKPHHISPRFVAFRRRRLLSRATNDHLVCPVYERHFRHEEISQSWRNWHGIPITTVATALSVPGCVVTHFRLPAAYINLVASRKKGSFEIKGRSVSGRHQRSSCCFFPRVLDPIPWDPCQWRRRGGLGGPTHRPPRRGPYPRSPVRPFPKRNPGDATGPRPCVRERVLR